MVVTRCREMRVFPLNWAEMPDTPVLMWVTFAIVAAAAILADLIIHRHARKISVQAALIETAAWIAVAMIFNIWIYFARGPQPAIEFLTGYIVEQSLSVDNILVFLIIFASFRVPEESQHRVLYYGVAGALVMRAAFVFAGIGLLQRFHFVIYFFGAILLIAAVKMLFSRMQNSHPDRSWLVRAARRVVPVTDTFEGGAFWVRRNGLLLATPLFLALVAAEATDIVFAVDSVPAVLAITRDAFIAYSSNVFAILGLRAMYFVLAGILPRLRFLDQGLAVILLFVGGEMVVSDWVKVPTALSLAIIAGILTLTVTASLLWRRQQTSDDVSESLRKPR
jgi:tellurite resistance protein TerC